MILRLWWSMMTYTFWSATVFGSRISECASDAMGSTCGIYRNCPLGGLRDMVMSGITIFGVQLPVQLLCLLEHRKGRLRVERCICLHKLA